MIKRAKKSSGTYGAMRFDIKTVSEANTREHWAVRNRRKKGQQSDFATLWRYYKPVINLPAVVTFTRYACQAMDSDNLAGAFKGIRDQLAKEIGIDDGSEQVEFRYRQQRINERQHFFTVEIEGK
jgi:hypothetical protein